jgi:RNA polymerase alpha subunit
MTEQAAARDPDEYVPCPRHGTHCFREIPDLGQRIECAIGLGGRGIAGVKATAERIMLMVEDHVLAELADVKAVTVQRDRFAEYVPIEELTLDMRAYNVLTTARIRFVGELLRMTEDDITDLRNAGSKTLKNIQGRLRDEFGLTLRQAQDQ